MHTHPGSTRQATATHEEATIYWHQTWSDTEGAWASPVRILTATLPRCRERTCHCSKTAAEQLLTPHLDPTADQHTTTVIFRTVPPWWWFGDTRPQQRENA